MSWNNPHMQTDRTSQWQESCACHAFARGVCTSLILTQDGVFAIDYPFPLQFALEIHEKADTSSYQQDRGH